MATESSKSGKSTTKKKDNKSTMAEKSTASKSATKQTASKSTDKSKASKTNRKGGAKVPKIVKSIAIWVGVFIVTLVVVDFAVQYLNHQASVAIVNGERIYKAEFNDKLEEACGASTVTQMIDEALINQEAKKQNLTVSAEDIDNEIKTLEESYGGSEKLEEELAMRNITLDSLRKQITTTLLVEEMLKDRIEITKEEKQEFYEQYKDVLFSEDEDPSFEEAEDRIIETLTDQKINQEYQLWIVEIQGSANIKNNVTDPKGFEFLGITRAFVVDLAD